MSCCIVIPVYRALNSPLEIVSLMQLKRLSTHDVYLVAPRSLPIDSYRKVWPEIEVMFFDDHCFESIASYNKLMLSQGFYENFLSKYEWMLIHQLDAFLFKNNLNDFCQMPYDYFGAPWYPAQIIRPGIEWPYLLKLLGKKIFVGNGGLSLRKIESVVELIKEKKSILNNWNGNEDGFFSYFGSFGKTFKSCPVDVASKFSIECAPRYWLTENNGMLPMGCHAFNKIETSVYADLINPLLGEIPGLIEALNGHCLPLPYEIA